MKYLHYLPIVLLVSCASIAHEDSLYSSYTSLSSAVKNQNFEKALIYISAENTRGVSREDAIEKFDENFPFVYSLSSVFTKEKNHFESISSGKSCLSINGYDASSEPLTVNVEYFLESGRQRIKYIEMNYLSGSDEFIKTPTCPTVIDNS